MENGKAKIIPMPGSRSGPAPIRPDQVNRLRGKMAEAVIYYMKLMEDRTLSRQDLIDTTANTVTLIINLLSITSDAVSVCSAARIIRDRMEAIRNALLPPIIAEVPDFEDQEQVLVDLLISDTGIVFEIYSAVLDEDQMESIINQFKGGSENANGGSEE